MIVLLSMDWRLALVTFSVLPLIVLVTQWFRRNVRESYRHGAHLDRADQRVPAGEHHRDVDGAAVPAGGASNFGRFDEINRQHRDANIDSIFYYAVFYPAIEIIGALARVAHHLVRRRPGARGALTLGSLVAFLQYSQRFFRPISDMSEKFNVLQAAMASSERIFKLLDTPVDDCSAAGADAVAPLVRPQAGPHHGFDHVWFAYNDDDYVLRDVSFDVAAGRARRRSSGRPAPGRPPSSTCCCASTT